MLDIVLEAELRQDAGKGASRRLRRLENKVLGIVYGGGKEPVSVQLPQNKVFKALENEAIFASMFSLKVNGKNENVILKAIQRHPFKPVIMHMDFQRVSQSDVLVKYVPLHFINEAEAKGVKAGGILTHNMTQVEVRCQVKNLPEYIEVDMAGVELDDVLHLSDIKLPKGVSLTVDVKDGSHNLPVVSIHAPRAGAADAETVAPSSEDEESSN